MSNALRPLVLEGDCLTQLKRIPDESVAAVVTDPPYGLSNTDPAHVIEALTHWANGDRDFIPTGRGFMGKEWDAFVPPPAVWDECMRILKPGGHLLAFAGSRTFDLMTLSIRFAGFDIRDSIAWLYGSGFPKSLDVGKEMDKLDAVAERRNRALRFTAWMRTTGVTVARLDELTKSFMGSHYLTDRDQAAIATADMFDRIRPALPPVPAEIEELVAQRTVESASYAARGVLTENAGTSGSLSGYRSNTLDHGIPQTAEAKTWQGWGTALKPAFEPIVVARKPLAGTVAANVLAHGTGALNIDATRFATTDKLPTASGDRVSELGGRWPANVVLDDSQAAALDEQTNTETSRFFYVAKAPKSERPIVDGTAHPTVKPLALMRWLIRLVCPPGECVVDPFAGSGTTLEAAYLEGMEAIGVELTPEYLPLIKARLDRVESAA